MSAEKTSSLPPRNQPEMPTYFRMDRVGRDEFLSQLGHFGEEHRAMFSRLCDLWEPDISYDKFFAKAGHEYLNAGANLHTLMTHLEKGNCGLIAEAFREGVLEKDRIILTDRDSLRFWYWTVENEWQACRASDRRSFPTTAAMKKRPGFPADALQPLSLAEISGSFIQQHADEVVLYALPDLDGKTLIVTPATLPMMIEVARLKIRAILADSPLQPVLAKMLGTMVTKLKTSLTHNDDEFWSRLSDAIVIHREDLLVKKANLSPELIISAKIMKIYARNELDEAERLREQDAEKREAMQGILAHLAKKDDFLTTPDEFDAQFDPYSAWPDLKAMFMAQYMRSTGRTGLPAVVNIGEDYLFRDHVFPLFKARHGIAAMELREFYLDMIERMLRTNNKDKITAFAGTEAFREDIRMRLTEEFPVLSDLLSKPRIVSEGIIHYATKVLKIADMSRVKSVLERYFISGSIRFKEPDQLFELSPGIMFSESFHRLPWLRRFLLRVFGRYESYVQSLGAEKAPTARKPSAGEDFDGSDGFEPVRGVPKPYRSRDPRYQSVTEEAVRRRKQSEASRLRYSARQQEQAWDEFRSAYEKKKGSR